MARELFRRFLERFADSLGAVLGATIVVVPAAYLLVYALQGVRIEEETARAFSIIVTVITILAMAMRVIR